MSGVSHGSFTICSVGDICLGDSPKMLGIGVRSVTQQKGGNYLFSEARKALQGDLVFGNLETALSNVGYNPHCFHGAQLRGDPAMAKVLKNAGFTVLNLANNHMMQHGPEVFQETCALLNNSGINVVGLRGTTKWHCQPLRLTHRGRKIGILGYSDPDDYGFEPLYALNSQGNVLEDVKQLRSEVDSLIVSLHWGNEFVRCPSQAQMNYARAIIDAGADLILGHHPHVIQRMDPYGSGWICYSLGNFVFDMIWNPRTVEGLVSVFNLSDEGVVLVAVHQLEINRGYAPACKPVRLPDIVAHVAEDEASSYDDNAYRELVLYQRRKHRNLGHSFLIRNFGSYDLTTYAKIWAQSFRSAIGIKQSKARL